MLAPYWGPKVGGRCPTRRRGFAAFGLARASLFSSGMQFVCKAKSHVGRRKNNEDSYIVRADLGLAVVADGMGGYEGGEIASDLVVKQLVAALADQPVEPDRSDVSHEYRTDRLRARVANGLHEAHRRVTQRRVGRLSMMGSTAAVLAWDGSRVVVGNVGDSRVYRLRDGVLCQITRDHSMVEEALAAGLDPQNVRALGYSHVLTRAVGSPGELRPDLFSRRLRPGDLFLLCSDGVWEPLAGAPLQEILRRVPPTRLADALVHRAYAAGGTDNMTALVLWLPRR